MSADVRIQPWGAGDRPLLDALLGDPAMTVHLGGPQTAAQLDERHARYLATADSGPVFRVDDAATGRPVGWTGYWERDHDGVPILETGWAVLPAHQGRGVATAATALAIAHARAHRAAEAAAGPPRAGGDPPERRHLHAFPAPANGASNGVCRRLGFTLLGTVELPLLGGEATTLNDWRLDLDAPFDVRPVTLPQTRDLRRRVLRPHQTAAELAAAEDDRAFAVAAVDHSGAIVACGHVAPDGEPGGWRVRGMATEPAARGAGAGSAVLQELVDHATAHGATRIWCNARTPAVTLYARAGFAVVSDRFELPDIGPHVVMERRPRRA